ILAARTARIVTRAWPLLFGPASTLSRVISSTVRRSISLVEDLPSPNRNLQKNRSSCARFAGANPLPIREDYLRALLLREVYHDASLDAQLTEGTCWTTADGETSVISVGRGAIGRPPVVVGRLSSDQPGLRHSRYGPASG